MTLFSLILALALEYWRPGRSQDRFASLFSAYADMVERYFDTGMRRHGIAAWILAVVPVLALTGWIHHVLYGFSPLLGWMWNVAILYSTLSFRRLGDALAGIRDALRNGDTPLARDLSQGWSGASLEACNDPEIARCVIESGLIHAHRHVFAIIVCFVLLPGPLGPVLYRLSDLLSARWGGRVRAPDAFGHFAARAFEIVDWIPARSTAAGFAIAGNFEDAVYCWRVQAASWLNQAEGVILASGAGALGVRLGDALREPNGQYHRPEVGVGDEADADFLQSAIGLIWRTLMLWLLLLLALEIARWAG